MRGFGKYEIKNVFFEIGDFVLCLGYIEIKDFGDFEIEDFGIEDFGDFVI